MAELSYAHEQAARALASVLRADELRRGGASIKSLTLGAHIRAKKTTYALTCETLRFLPVLKEVLDAAGLPSSSLKSSRPELVYVLAYELLLGKGLQAEKGSRSRSLVAQALLGRRSALHAALARLLVQRKAASAEELLPPGARRGGPSAPRYVRVNTLRLAVADAQSRLQHHLAAAWPSAQSGGGTGAVEAVAGPSVTVDPLIPELLVLPPGTDLHAHPLVHDGSLVLQGKSSCMPARALDPHPDWDVMDACAAPGNKTSHLAAMMGAGCAGRIVACERDEERAARLKEAVEVAGAGGVVEVRCCDFLQVDPEDEAFQRVRFILLDPSCSGSGTKLRRMDNLLPSVQAAATSAGRQGGKTELEEIRLCVAPEEEKERVERLARFQEKALAHALRFPSLHRLVYSTCSIYRRENEDVVAAVLPLARARGMRLGRPFPQWHRRGLPVIPDAHHLVRVDSQEDKTDGFFLALFEREGGVEQALGQLGRVACQPGPNSNLQHFNDRNNREAEAPSLSQELPSVLRGPSLDQRHASSDRGQDSLGSSGTKAMIGREGEKTGKKRKRRRKGDAELLDGCDALPERRLSNGVVMDNSRQGIEGVNRDWGASSRKERAEVAEREGVKEGRGASVWTEEGMVGGEDVGTRGGEDVEACEGVEVTRAGKGEMTEGSEGMTNGARGRQVADELGSKKRLSAASLASRLRRRQRKRGRQRQQQKTNGAGNRHRASVTGEAVEDGSATISVPVSGVAAPYVEGLQRKKGRNVRGKKMQRI